MGQLCRNRIGKNQVMFQQIQIFKQTSYITYFFIKGMLKNHKLLFSITKQKNTSNPPPKAIKTQEQQDLVRFGQYAYSPQINSQQHLDLGKLNEVAVKIYKWAKLKNATHYSFLSYPHTSSICQKQESFLNVKYIKSESQSAPKELIENSFTGKILIKGQGDGSSFPSGGMRITHTARGYTIWDPLSQVFIHKKKNLLYIPSLLVTHHGYALDDKTLFRQAEKILKNSTVELLNKLGVATKSAVILLGLEQQFFAVPRSAYNSRQDLRFLGRTLTGNVPPRNQQLGEHYYGKLPQQVRQALLQVESQLLQMGIPLKTKHNEVALNQFQICSICNDAGRAIDQNMILMQVLKEVFEKHGLAALLHQKPFKDINGSGKHANWSLNYVKNDGTLKNLFSTQATDSPHDVLLFKLFILMNLKAVLKNHRLYMTAIATPGNQIRLGGHQAPPRIISVFLGTALSNLLDGKQQKVEKNLKELITYLNFDVKQQNTDRNRTSPYAYTGNRFQFRALGSSQNPSYALAVISATLSQQIKQVTQRIAKGEKLQTIVQNLLQETRTIRFEGNGYSPEWKEQAKKRGLYVNQTFTQIYSFMEKEQAIFQQLNICSKQQTHSRTNVVQNNYKQTVNIEQATLLLIADKHIIPRGYQHLQRIKGDFHSSILDREYTSFKKALEQVIEKTNLLRKKQLKDSDHLDKYQSLREQVEHASDIVTNFTKRLPHEKQSAFPDLYQFLRM